MKILIGILFTALVLLFTCFSRGCGGYEERLESDLASRAREKLEELGLGELDTSVELYDVTLQGEVPDFQTFRRAEALLAEHLPAGRGRIVNRLRYPGSEDPLVAGGGEPSGPPPGPLVEIVLDARGVGGGELGVDEAALREALGVREGDAVTPDDLGAMGARLEALEGVGEASLELQPADGGQRLFASITGAPGAGQLVATHQPATDPKAGTDPGSTTPPGTDPAGPRPTQPVPTLLAAVDIRTVGGVPMARAVVMEGIGLRVGDPFTIGQVGEIRERLASIAAIDRAEITAEETPEGFRLIAAITAAGTPGQPVPDPVPGPAVLSAVAIEAAPGSFFQRADVLQAAALAVGDPYSEESLAAARERIEALPGIASARIVAAETAEGYELTLKVRSTPPPVAMAETVAAIDLVFEGGAKLKKQDAYSAMGIKPGDPYNPDNLRAGEAGLAAIEGIARASLAPLLREGGYHITATIVGEESAPPAGAESPSPAGSLPALLAQTDIFFETGETEVGKDGRGKLERAAAALLAAGGDTKIVITGFADARGDPRANRRLSELRATRVRDALVEYGLSPSSIEVRGDGVPGDEETLAKQRRVEVRPSR